MDNPGEDNWVFSIGSGEYQVCAAMFSESGLVEWRAGNDTNDVLVWDLGYIDPEFWTEWYHWVFVKDEDAGTMSIYIGYPAIILRCYGCYCSCTSESKSGVNRTLVNVQGAPMKIGAVVDHNSDYIGSIDDFRLFDRSLEEREICSCWDNDLAWMPNPFNGQLDVPYDTVLEWHPGDSAVYHDVYLGTGYSAVADANTNSAVYRDRFDSNSYDPCGLSFDATYYWRIDEANDSEVWKGYVWQFTTADFIVVDDMESYDPLVEFIWYYWENPDWNGSWIMLGSSLWQPVHGGIRSMEYEYNNNYELYGYYSEVEYSYDSGQDWTVQGVKVLTLYFYGDPNNDANNSEQMYIGVEDSTGVSSYSEVRYGDNGEDMNDIKLAEWQEWNVALSEFTDITLTDVRIIYLGFGDRAAVAPGGEGLVYFDDLRLYRSRCASSTWMPDFDDDCKVGFGDLKILADSWLEENPDIEMSGDSIINGADFSIFASYWMEDQHWP
ncbi:MAG: hypothetical protein ACYSWP_13345 [Planctomycetota bacterium]|jgi:hypothetical protein